jgi:hypothetical protein
MKAEKYIEEFIKRIPPGTDLEKELPDILKSFIKYLPQDYTVCTN